MNKSFILLLLIFLLTGCSSFIYKYNNESKVFIPNIESIPAKFNINEFEYIPPSGVGQRDIIHEGIFVDNYIPVDTRISHLVKNEIVKISKKYDLYTNKKVTCQLNGEIHFLGKLFPSEDNKSTIRYSLVFKDKEIFYKTITFIWNRPFIYEHGGISQTLGNSIHGNFSNLAENSNFRKILNKYCKNTTIY